MEKNDIEGLIRQSFPNAKIYIEGEGCDFSAIVISDVFEDVSPVQKQKSVLATVKGNLATGELHAMSVQAYTESEWEQKRIKMKENKSPQGLVNLN